METATESKPQIRVRIAHTHTLKDGWRLSETTVEFTGTSIDSVAMATEMEIAHTIGEKEAVARNNALEANAG
jgi:hypothetical protein